MYDTIIILGPTATGKTDISIQIAKKLNADIVNADSMYIYKDLNIGTAKPTIDEMDGINHHLISFVEPDSDMNVALYRESAKKCIDNLFSNNILPIIVGGTGFYIDSLIKNYSYGQVSKNFELRNDLEKEYDLLGGEYLHKKLQELDYESSLKIHPNDKYRLIRCLELALDGNKKSNIINNDDIILKNPLIIGLNIDRETLYSRINKRVDIMINNGLIDEVKSLVKRGLNPIQNQSMKGIGYKEIYSYLSNECSLDESIEKIKQHTRNYAKRQITWFKRNKDIIWFDSINQKNEIISFVIDKFNKCI